MTCGLYCITNKINGKKYFGQSINIEERMKAYFNKSQFPNDHIKNAFNKYGKENFEFKIIKVCKEKYLDRFEKIYIRINDTQNPDKGYNKDSGGNLNKHHSEETKKKISEGQKGEKNHMYGEHHTEETKNKMSKAKSGENHPNYGGHHSDETKQKMSESHTGKTHLEETKRKIGEANLKDYPRITKQGKNSQGKQRYGIKYKGKIITYSINKEKLYKKWYDKYPNIELIDETK